MHRAVLALIVLCGFAASCGSSPSTPTPSQNPPPAPNENTNSIVIPSGAYQGTGGSSFSPSTTTVPVGTTVTWTNNDITTHTVTSDTNVWNSGNLAPGDSYSFTFNTKGTFAYHCMIHGFMRGTVVVQ
jgi:plastocyanin